MIQSTRKPLGSLLSLILLGTLSGACSQEKPALHLEPAIQAPQLPAPDSSSPGFAPLPNGALLRVHHERGLNLIEAEAIITPHSFQQLARRSLSVDERTHLLNRDLSIVVSQLEARGARVLYRADEVGFLSLLLPFEAGSTDLFSAVRKLGTSSNLIFSPVYYDLDALETARAHSTLLPRALPRSRSEGFSGLALMGIEEFERLLSVELAGHAPINGSTVRIGIADTGITLNHPTFGNRIASMKDFTREGRVYFLLDAPLEARTGTDETEVLVSANVIQTPKLPSLPLADRPTRIQDLKIRVSPKLRQTLLNEESRPQFRLGFLLEESLNGPEDPVDLNRNGSRSDRLPILLQLNPDDLALSQFYVDFSGSGDFRNVRPLQDWNQSRKSARVIAERIGFELKKDELPVSEPNQPNAQVLSLSIVGYDPGNHGSHVAGIAAGGRIISNDAEGSPARGVAPEAALLMNRVCSNNAGCQAAAAIADLALSGRADVINMSLGGLSPFNDGFNAQEVLINRLATEKNVLFVISAGNSGPGRQTIGSPSTARLSLSIGAAATAAMVQRQYQYPGFGASDGSALDTPFMLFFSSRGPTAAGGFKPSLVAPGTQLSSIHLNAAPETLPGLEVYWGTSMAAPAATGAYALLLDAIRKYNRAFPALSLPTDPLVLRSVLLESAQPFDVTRTDLSRETSETGQYTWLDQGTGMIHLPSAWALLKRLHSEEPPHPVRGANDSPVQLDYEVLVESKTSPSRNAYDGTRISASQHAIFGSGVYLDYFSTETLRRVAIARKIPEGRAVGPELGSLLSQLATTSETFELRTVIHGSHIPWIKAGVLNAVPGSSCAEAQTAPLTLIGQSATAAINADGKGTLSAARHSSLNLCLDRELIQTQLEPGDHGALIYAYRTVHGAVSPVASFIVPVTLSVPHRSLEASLRYDFKGSVRGFGVKRHYLNVPEGISVLRVLVEVPEPKTVNSGRRLETGEHCSGIELMALEGANTARVFRSRPEGRVSNCTLEGSPQLDRSKRMLTINRTNPRAGLWNLHILGQYEFDSSEYRIQADYIRAQTDSTLISGDESALTGTLRWTVSEWTVETGPQSVESVFELEGFHSSTTTKVANGARTVVEGALGKLRRYPEKARSVEVKTGGSAGNDIDLRIYECDSSLEAYDSDYCTLAGESGGSTDVESVTFVPKAGKTYAVEVHGYEITRNEGEFYSIENIRMPPERGNVAVSGAHPVYVIDYSFGQPSLEESRILNNDLYISGKCGAFGRLKLKSDENLLLGEVPISIRKAPPRIGLPRPPSGPTPAP